jgi:hypothetical protein
MFDRTSAVEYLFDDNGRSCESDGPTEVSSMNLELYQYYTRDEIFEEFKKSQPTEAEGWFLSSMRLVGLFAIGECPPDVHFCDNSRFHWYARENESVPKPIQDFKSLNGGYERWLSVDLQT